MAKLSVVAGATSQSITIKILDSSSTIGAGLSALVYNTSGLICYYTFTGTNAAATAVTLATLAAVNSAYSSGGFKEIDATNMKGYYRLDLPNAAIAASKGRSVVVTLGGATNMAPCDLEIELTGWDNQDAVHGGLSALPNTAVTTNASLLTSGTGTDQLSVTSGRVDAGKLLGTAISTPATAGILDVNVKNINNVAAATPGAAGGVFIAGTNAATTVTTALTTTFTGNLTGSVGSVTGAVGSVTGAVGSVTGNVGGNVVGSVASVTARVTANADQLAGQTVTAAAGVTFPTSVASPTNITAGTITTVTNLTNAPTAGDLTATMKTSVTTAATAATPTVTVGAVAAAASNIKKNTSFDISFPMTDSTNHLPATGLTVTATRSIDGAAYGACVNAVTEVGAGTYNIVFAAADTNGNSIMYKFTAASSDTRLLEVITQP